MYGQKVLPCSRHGCNQFPLPEEEEAEGGDGGGQETGEDHRIGVEGHLPAPPREEGL